MKRATVTLIVLLLCTISYHGDRRAASPPGHAAPSESGLSSLAQATDLGFLPIYFEENRGQVDSGIRFLSRSGPTTLALTADGAAFVPTTTECSGKVHSLAGGGAPAGFRLRGARAKPFIKGVDILPGKSHYLVGKDRSNWHTNIPQFRSVRYEDVYPGIDLLFHGEAGRFEFDFFVAPHHEPGIIAIDLPGSAFSDDDGNLHVKSDCGDFLLEKPFAYQKKNGTTTPVAVAFDVAEQNNVRFALGPYDRDRELIIDPVLSYSSYIGASGEYTAEGVAVDTTGNAYMAGMIAGAEGGAYVKKIDNSGQFVLYHTVFGGAATDQPRDLAIDALGNAYIVGWTTSANFAGTSGSRQGTDDGFVVKIKPDGSDIVFARYLGGGENGIWPPNGHDSARSIAVDSDGNAWITGYTDADDFPTTGGAFRTIRTGGQGIADAFVTKLGPSGSITYSTYLGGLAGSDIGEGIAVDREGNAYVTGTTGSSSFPTTEGVASGGGGFLTKFNAAATELVYSGFLGGVDVAVDSEGNAYTTYGGSVLKVNVDATEVLYDIGVSGAEARAIAVDDVGRAYIVGSTYGGLDTVDPVQGEYGGGFCSDTVGDDCPDAFVSVVNVDGTGLEFSTYLGGAGDESLDEAYAVDVDAVGNIYVVGQTKSENFPVVNALEPDGGGWFDAFIVRIALAAEAAFTCEATTVVGEFGQVESDVTARFTRALGETVSIETQIVRFSPDTLLVRMTPDLIWREEEFIRRFRQGSLGEIVTLEITVREGQPGQARVAVPVFWIYPDSLIYDMTVVPPVRVPQHVLPQYDLLAPYPPFQRGFFFIGRSEDELAGIRALNTQLGFPPLTLDMEAFWPGSGEVSYFEQFNEGPGNKGLHLVVDRDSLCVVCVFQEEGVSVPFDDFPLPFQLHLAGDAGLARKLITGEPEYPRAARTDILFNHVAPRPQELTLFTTTLDQQGAETSLFKFANHYSISGFAVAVLIPPADQPDGARPGETYIRARDPADPLEITTPTAQSPTIWWPSSFQAGRVIDFTQIPIPESVVRGGRIDGTVAAVVGDNALVGEERSVFSFTAQDDIRSLILDMGAGQEVVDGVGNDLKIFAPVGSYTVAVSNTPYGDTFRPVGGVVAGTAELDISSAGLTSARYIRITAAPAVTLEAVKALNVFADEVRDQVGPVLTFPWATPMMQRAKARQTDINPFLQMFAPDGKLIDHNPGDFGDPTNQLLTDAALKTVDLAQLGFYRFLAKGFDVQPTPQALGRFFVRLETHGDWPTNSITVSNLDEEQTAPQGNGILAEVRERHSYLFQEAPGTFINIVVEPLNDVSTPILELYDPEGFMIGANDGYPGRGNDAILSMNLPLQSFDSDSLMPDPSSYRLVVSSPNGVGGRFGWEDLFAHINQPSGLRYNLRVFRGALSQGVAVAPTVQSVTPDRVISGASGLRLAVVGDGFQDGAVASFSGDDVEVVQTAFITKSQLDVFVNVAMAATPGSRDVTVTNPDGLDDTASGVLVIAENLGSVNLTWDPPTGGELAPPENLESTLETSAVNTIGQSLQTNQIGLGEFEDVEPNNNTKQAQELFGESPIIVNGRLEVNDKGSFFPSNDFEDMYVFETVSEGLEVLLDEFTSNADFFIFALPDTLVPVAWAFDLHPTRPETFSDATFPIGQYLIGVSIYDADPQGSDTTDYRLTLTGTFDDGSAPTLESYRVYRSDLPGARLTGSFVGEVESSTTFFTDPAPANGGHYYQVTSMYDRGESDPSNEISIWVTSTDVDETNGVPDRFALKQNYPNPFNPSTRIRYELPTPTHVTIEIFDMLGRRVRTLLDERRDAGFHEIVWDGSTSNGLEASSGVFIYRLRAGGVVKTRMMVLVK